MNWKLAGLATVLGFAALVPSEAAYYVPQPDIRDPEVRVFAEDFVLRPDPNVIGSNIPTTTMVTVTWPVGPSSANAVTDFSFWGDYFYGRVLEAQNKGQAPPTTPIASAYPWVNVDINTDMSASCSKSGGMFVCETTITAPTTNVGVFTLAFHVADAVIDKVVYINIEVTCSDLVFCNGEERFTSKLKCQPPGEGYPKPCWIGEGHCKQHECFEETKTCSKYPQVSYDNGQSFTTLTTLAETNEKCLSNCDLQNCGQKCLANDECGITRCGEPCFLALGNLAPGDPGSDGKCTGVMKPCPDGPGNCATSCQKGKCVATSSNTPGTCASPAKLFSYEPQLNNNGQYPVPADGMKIPFVNFHEIFHIDARGGVDSVKPSCGAEGVRDLIVRFTTPSASSPLGMEIRTYSPTETALDTLAELRGVKLDVNGNIVEGCVDLNLPTGFCSDDASPPGNFGSRLFGKLQPDTTYDLVLSYYSDQSASDVTVVEIWISGNDCVPQCEGKTCGDDGCGRSCGSCSAGSCCYTCKDRDNCKFGDSFCTEGTPLLGQETCEMGLFECSADCANRQCGPSANRCPDNNYDYSPNAPFDPLSPDPITQCGSNAGACREGYECSYLDGRCKKVSSCNPFAPVCDNLNLKSGKFCGTDCLWHDLETDFVDLVINGPDLVNPSLEFTYTDVSPTSPALAEGCLGSSGNRLLMRFDTWVWNIGRVGFNPPSPELRPDLFEFSYVHAHNHYKTFARFGLLDIDTDEWLTPGGKLAYCMEDTERFLFGPRFPCTFSTDCDNQGISIGGADLYSAVLDCQWLDVTDLLQDPVVSAQLDANNRIVTYYAEANFGRSFQEASWENNIVRYQIYVPTVSELSNGSIKYCQFVCSRGDIVANLGGVNSDNLKGCNCN